MAGKRESGEAEATNQSRDLCSSSVPHPGSEPLIKAGSVISAGTDGERSDCQAMQWHRLVSACMVTARVTPAYCWSQKKAAVRKWGGWELIWMGF